MVISNTYRPNLVITSEISYNGARFNQKGSGVTQEIWLWVGSVGAVILVGYLVGKIVRFAITAALLILLAYAFCVQQGYDLRKFPRLTTQWKVPASVQNLVPHP
jgi:hypothetical protein